MKLKSLLLPLVAAVASSSDLVAGTLTLSEQNAQFQNFNLSTYGTSVTDWAIWGYGSQTSLTPSVRLNGGTAIGNLGNIDTSPSTPLRGLGQFGNYGESYFNWLNGNTVATATSFSPGYSGLQHNGGGATPQVNDGFSLPVQASTTVQTLLLFTTTHRANAHFTVSLSDNSAAPVSFNFIGSDTTYNSPSLFTILFASDSAATLNVTYVTTTDYSTTGVSPNTGNVAIQGAWLGTTTVVPEPSTAALAGVSGLSWLLFRRQRK